MLKLTVLIIILNTVNCMSFQNIKETEKPVNDRIEENIKDTKKDIKETVKIIENLPESKEKRIISETLKKSDSLLGDLKAENLHKTAVIKNQESEIKILNKKLLEEQNDKEKLNKQLSKAQRDAGFGDGLKGLFFAVLFLFILFILFYIVKKLNPEAFSTAITKILKT